MRSLWRKLKSENPKYYDFVWYKKMLVFMLFLMTVPMSYLIGAVYIGWCILAGKSFKLVRSDNKLDRKSMEYWRSKEGE